MQIGITSALIGSPSTTLPDLIGEIRGAEEDGFAFFSLPHIFGVDAITALALAGRETERIELATGVVPSPPRHPMALAQQALTAQAATGGRFVLGIGLSHKIVIESMMGLSYDRPAAQMREYLEVLVPLCEGKPAAFEGDIYRVNGGVQVAGAERVPVVVAALGPLMLKIAGRLADGTATWMTGPRTLAEHTVPTIRKAAQEAGRADPRVIASLPIALVSDVGAAREKASQAFQIYGTLPSYRAMLDREGVANPGDVALVGDEAALRSALESLASSGVTHFSASLFPADDGAIARTRAFLKAELAA